METMPGIETIMVIITIITTITDNFEEDAEPEMECGRIIAFLILEYVLLFSKRKKIMLFYAVFFKRGLLYTITLLLRSSNFCIVVLMSCNKMPTDTYKWFILPGMQSWAK